MQKEVPNINRAEFLRELKENLNDKVPVGQIADILYDYGEHFDAGLRDGKTEDEVSEELGSPAKISRALLSEINPELTDRRTDSLPYAPLGMRLAAFIIDGLVAGLPVLIITGSVFPLLFLPLAPITALQYSVSHMGEGPPVWLGQLSVLFFVLYQPVSLALWKGQSIGKRLLNLRVVSKDGRQLNTGAFLSREILGRTVVNTLTLGLSSAISFLWALFSPERRTIHDEIGGTRVIMDRT